MTATSNPIRSATRRGKTIRLRFGTRVFRDLSDGQFPVELWRVNVAVDGTRSEEHVCTSRKPSTLARAKSRASQGWRSACWKSWVEARTPKARTPKARTPKARTP